MAEPSMALLMGTNPQFPTAMQRQVFDAWNAQLQMLIAHSKAHMAAATPSHSTSATKALQPVKEPVDFDIDDMDSSDLEVEDDDEDEVDHGVAAAAGTTSAAATAAASRGARPAVQPPLHAAPVPPKRAAKLGSDQARFLSRASQELPRLNTDAVHGASTGSINDGADSQHSAIAQSLPQLPVTIVTSPPGSPIIVTATYSSEPDILSPRSASDVPAKEGWLYKKGKGLHKWQKRYFVLASPFLHYYREQPRGREIKPVDSIPLHGCTVGQQYDKETPIMVINQTAQKSYYLQAETPSQFEQWMVAIGDMLQQLPVKPTVDTTAQITPAAKSNRSSVNRLRQGAADMSQKLNKLKGDGSRRKKQAAARTATPSPTFGVPLSEVTNLRGGLPRVVYDSLQYLEFHIEAEGLFRKSGLVLTIQTLKRDYDSGNNPVLAAVDDPHAVAGVMKLFFREMPEPLLPFDTYDHFERASELPETERLEEICRIVNSLPPINNLVLRYLIVFLARVASYQAINMMTPQNLSIVFSPNIMRKKDASMIEAMMQSKVANTIVSNMIEWAVNLFPEGASLAQLPDDEPSYEDEEEEEEHHHHSKHRGPEFASSFVQ